MKKVILMVVIGFIVLLVALTVVVSIYIGPIVKYGIEQMGPKVTQVSVTVDSVGISLSGSAELKGLKVGNPSGYTSPQAFSAGTVAVSVDPTSLASKKIVVRAVHVVSPQISFEGGLSGNNLTKIQDNVNAFIKAYVPPSNNPPPKIEVDDFLMTGAKVDLNVQGLGSKDVPLPDIHLTGLGKGTDGMTPQELISAVLQSITSDTLKTVTSSFGNISQGLQSIGKNTLSNIGSSLGGLFGKQ